MENTDMIWDEHMEKVATEMWQKGRSGSEIGKVLGKSRNAVMGKLMRMGVLKKVNRSDITHFKSIKKPKETEPYDPKNRDHDKSYATPKPLSELKSCECVFPLGGLYDKAELFCAAPVYKNGYCEAHYKVCFKTKQKDD